MNEYARIFYACLLIRLGGIKQTHTHTMWWCKSSGWCWTDLSVLNWVWGEWEIFHVSQKCSAAPLCISAAHYTHFNKQAQTRQQLTAYINQSSVQPNGLYENTHLSIQKHLLCFSFQLREPFGGGWHRFKRSRCFWSHRPSCTSSNTKDIICFSFCLPHLNQNDEVMEKDEKISGLKSRYLYFFLSLRL